MPTYQILFDGHLGTSTLIQLWAEIPEQAIQFAKGQASALAQRTGNLVIAEEVCAVKEVAP